MQDNQEALAEDLNYKIPPAVAKKLVKLHKQWGAVREYLDLFRQYVNYRLKSPQDTPLDKGAELVAMKAAGWMAAMEVVDTMYNLTEVAKEVVDQYDEYQAALAAQEK